MCLPLYTFVAEDNGVVVLHAFSFAVDLIPFVPNENPYLK